MGVGETADSLDECFAVVVEQILDDQPLGAVTYLVVLLTAVRLGTLREYAGASLSVGLFNLGSVDLVDRGL